MPLYGTSPVGKHMLALLRGLVSNKSMSGTWAVSRDANRSIFIICNSLNYLSDFLLITQDS